MTKTKTRLSDIERWLRQSPVDDVGSEHSAAAAPRPAKVSGGGGSRRIIRFAILAATVMMAGFVVAVCMRRAGATLPLPARARGVWQTIARRIPGAKPAAPPIQAIHAGEEDDAAGIESEDGGAMDLADPAAMHEPADDVHQPTDDAMHPMEEPPADPAEPMEGGHRGELDESDDPNFTPL
jgi:hypothetical protein